MNRGTAMLLAPHAARMHSLLAASPAHWVLAVAVLAVLLLWTVTTVSPRRSR